MKLPPFKPLTVGQAAEIHQTIERALSAAGLDTRSGPMRGVSETVRQALASAGLGARRADPAPDDAVIDVSARWVDVPPAESRPAEVGLKQRARPSSPARFVMHTFTHEAGIRNYKLYVPRSATAGPMPLIVMLHGCTQSPDDFAAGTQMNRLAEEQGFIVVYPEQPSSANMSKCWNWFNAQDQRRNCGEPSLIAGITREVMAMHAVDPHRIFVAGLSAGAAMAVVMGETYPELYAGVGSHSGLPYASAHDIPSAMAAMKGSRRSGGDPLVARSKLSHGVPTIVFHGDRDHTVRQTNGQAIAAQACAAYGTGAVSGASAQAPSSTTEQGASAGGRTYSRTVHADASGGARVESWVLHGAGHAWSGGDASGSFTDPAGPMASAEMVRFFLALPRHESA